MCNCSEISKDLSSTVTCNSTLNATAQYAIFFRAQVIDTAHALKEQCFLHLHVSFDTLQKGPQGRVASLKERLEAVMPHLDSLVVRAMPSIDPSCWFHLSGGNKAGA